MNVEHTDPEDLKHCFLRVRVTQSEHDDYLEQAKRMGYKSFSKYLRSLLVDDKKSTDKLLNEKVEQLKDLIIQNKDALRIAQGQMNWEWIKGEMQGMQLVEQWISDIFEKD